MTISGLLSEKYGFKVGDWFQKVTYPKPRLCSVGVIGGEKLTSDSGSPCPNTPETTKFQSIQLTPRDKKVKI